MQQPIGSDHIIDAIWKIVSRRVSERAAATVDLVDEMLQSFGRLHRKHQELWAGDRLLNDDRDLLGMLSRATSLGLSLYLGNRRIATASAVDAGPAEPVGGYADAELVDTVLRKRETFRGMLDIQGRPHIVACRPLLATGDSDYGPLGMIEAYQDVETIREVLRNGLREGLDLATSTSSQEQADRMEAVMHFIDDVARRLQLLALNGNIIAAQAGDHGRAFRVVCRELSSLADQSKDAVAEVRRLTHDIRTLPEDEVDDPVGAAVETDATDENDASEEALDERAP